KIVLVLVAAVLLLGGAAAVFESVAVSLWKMPVFDPEYPRDGTPFTPDGDPLPPGPL
ncbi:MAG: hypothetical protein HXS48_17425, partial [Theionarchaea archaeon]|nr:hypothetical protein [Theionarchaea archaeon]